MFDRIWTRGFLGHDHKLFERVIQDDVNVTTSCDACNDGKKLLEGTVVYSCKSYGCNIDFCLPCLREYGKSKLACPQRHAMNYGKAEHDNYKCDICLSKIPLHGKIFSCRICNYDYCSECESEIREIIFKDDIKPVVKAIPKPIPKVNHNPASINSIQNKINASLSKSHPGWSCKTIQWNDASRGTVNGSLSSWGSNITDVRLWAKDGTPLYTVRTDNFNEKLGKVNAKDVAILQDIDGVLQPITLQKWLQNSAAYGKYAGLKSNLHSKIDDEVSIRFQTTFLPPGIDFCTEHYNYQTRDNDNPKNIILLATTQGSSLQQDMSGANRLFLHNIDAKGNIHRHYLECEATRHKVGGQQIETKEEREDAVARGKATSSVIGIRAMGTRFNVLMTIQIPIEQTQAIPRVNSDKMYKVCAAKKSTSSMFGGLQNQSLNFFSSSKPAAAPTKYCKKAYESEDDDDDDDDMFMDFATAPATGDLKQENLIQLEDSMDLSASGFCEAEAPSLFTSFKESLDSSKKKKIRARVANKITEEQGKASAARVSRGSEFDKWTGLKKRDATRSKNEHITITCVTYYTIEGGVPTEADVQAAVNDLTSLYRSTEWNGKLSDANFMTKELTFHDANVIQNKIIQQPYIPATSKPIANFDAFPS